LAGLFKKESTLKAEKQSKIVDAARISLFGERFVYPVKGAFVA